MPINFKFRIARAYNCLSSLRVVQRVLRCMLLVTYICSWRHNLPRCVLTAILFFFFGLECTQKERLVFVCLQDVRAIKVSAELSQLPWLHRPLSFLKLRTNNTSRDICSATSVSSCLIAAEVCSALAGLCTEPGGLHRPGWFGVVPGLGMGWQERIFLPFSPIRVLMSPGSRVHDHHGRFCGMLWVVQPRSEGEEGFWGQLHSSRGAGGTLPGMSSKPSLFGETSQKMLLFNFIDL